MEGGGAIVRDAKVQHAKMQSAKIQNARAGPGHARAFPKPNCKIRKCKTTPRPKSAKSGNEKKNKKKHLQNAKKQKRKKCKKMQNKSAKKQSAKTENARPTGGKCWRMAVACARKSVSIPHISRACASILNLCTLHFCILHFCILHYGPPPPPSALRPAHQPARPGPARLGDRKSTRLNSSHQSVSRMPSSA